MNSNIAMVIVSCDKYKDTWSPFFKCLTKFWPICDMNKYLVNNKEDDIAYDANIINTGTETSWSSKVRYALSKINEDYILFLLDDYFFDLYVDEKTFCLLFESFKNLGIDYLSFEPAKLKDEIGSSLIAKISLRNVYGKVLQPAIWKKSYLQKCLYDDDFSAWEFEGRQKNKSKIRIIGNDFCVKKHYFSWRNGVLQGKWYPPTIRRMNKIGIEIDINSRDVLSQSKTNKYRIKTFLAKHIPTFLITPARKLLEKIGYKFITRSY